MKYKWLNRGKNNKIILFFNGWGMDENVVNHLDSEDYDVLMFYDYNSLDTDFDFELLEAYFEKNLIAWSMGVMVAAYLAPSLALPLGEGKRTAINGTLKPIDEEYGIHPKIYDLTIKGFNEKGRDRFIKSMFDAQTPPPNPLPQGAGERSLYNQQSELPPHPNPLTKEREIKEQLSELIALKELCVSTPPPNPLPQGAGERSLYNKVLISDNDKIIPTKSQVAFWGIEPNIKGGHCPFFQFSKWSELL